MVAASFGEGDEMQYLQLFDIFYVWLHNVSDLLVVILLSGNTSAFRLNRLNKRNLDLETDSDFENSERIVNQVRRSGFIDVNSVLKIIKIKN